MPQMRVPLQILEGAYSGLAGCVELHQDGCITPSFGG